MGRKDLVLFLGSGATHAADNDLPCDGAFFKSEKVRNKLKDYCVLQKLLEDVPALKSDSLFGTWNNLFIYRGLSLAGLVHGIRYKGIESFLKECGPRYAYELKALDCPFNVDKTNEYKYAEIAIREVRHLVVDVYQNRDVAKCHGQYLHLWSKIGHRVSAVVNLNYDSTFDRSFEGPDIPFFYPGKAVGSAIPFVRPHGSLDWSVERKFGVGEGWRTYVSGYRQTPRGEMGFGPTSDEKILSYKAPLIVDDNEFKEQIVGNSTIGGFQDSTIRQQWVTLKEILEKAGEWLFYGWSIESGDNHLKYLLREHSRGKTIQATLHNKPEECRFGESFPDASSVCYHKVGDSMESFLFDQDI